MEITRQLKPVLASQTEAPQQARTSAAEARRPVSASAPAESLPLEQLQDALGALPEIDLAKVEAIKQALQRGEISLDVGVLSRSMLAYHNGSDA
jgi:negative regulator of flagellin synthesis FlgM